MIERSRHHKRLPVAWLRNTRGKALKMPPAFPRLPLGYAEAKLMDVSAACSRTKHMRSTTHFHAIKDYRVNKREKCDEGGSRPTSYIFRNKNTGKAISNKSRGGTGNAQEDTHENKKTALEPRTVSNKSKKGPSQSSLLAPSFLPLPPTTALETKTKTTRYKQQQ